MLFKFASKGENATVIDARVERPLISFITVSYNSANHIQQTIASVAACKKLLSCEHIIIDGNSTDGTKRILNEYNQIIDRVVMEPDSGIYDAMNKGLTMARGEYVCYQCKQASLLCNYALNVCVCLRPMPESRLRYNLRLLLHCMHLLATNARKPACCVITTVFA
jgi:hypothetical protein